MDDSQKAAIRLSIERAGKNICVDCGSPNIISQPNSTWPNCRACRDRRNEKYAERSKIRAEAGLIRHEVSPETRNNMYAATRKRVATAGTLGLCKGRSGYCQNKPVPGKTKCQDCLDYFAKYRQTYKRKKT